MKMEALDKRSQKRLVKIFERCEVLVQIVMQMQLTYFAESTSVDQRNFMETIVGAGLWYIPNKGLWTGRISVEATRSFHPESGVKTPSLTEDHQYPRKVAASELFNRNWEDEKNPAATLFSLFIKQYGRYNYVTKRENKVLVPYQKAGKFTTPDHAYAQAGIVLLTISKEQLDRIKDRDRHTIEILLQNPA